MQKIMRLLTLATVVASMCFPLQSFGANAAANTVVSTSIAPADGKTGQALTTGNGVKTGHIQDAAITAAKLAKGSVSSSKIFGQLSTSKLRVGTSAGTVAAGDHTHVIGTANLADGAITDAKISGPISGNKIAGSLGVEKLGVYAGTKIVHKGAVDNLNSFNSIVAALNSIGSTTAPYAIIVMPGIYEEDFSGYNSANLINVDIIGQSRTNSIIKAVGFTYPGLPYYSIDMPASMSFTNLTFQGFIAIGRTNNRITNCIVIGGRGIFFNSDATNAIIDNVEIDSTEIGVSSYDLHAGDTISLNNVKINMQQGIPGSIGMHLREAYWKPVKLSNIAITGAAVGIQLYVGAYIIDNMSITNSGVGFSTSYFGMPGGATATIINSKFDVPRNEIIGTSENIQLENSTVRGLVVTGTSIKIGNSKIIGTLSGGGTTTVVNSYDENFVPIPNGIY